MNFNFSEMHILQISSHPYMCVEKILGGRNRPKSKPESANGVPTTRGRGGDGGGLVPPPQARNLTCGGDWSPQTDIL